MSQWYCWGGLVKEEEKDVDQNGLNVQESEHVQNKAGRWLTWARLGRIDYGTMDGVVGEDWMEL